MPVLRYFPFAFKNTPICFSVLLLPFFSWCLSVFFDTYVEQQKSSCMHKKIPALDFPKPADPLDSVAPYLPFSVFLSSSSLLLQISAIDSLSELLSSIYNALHIG